MIVDILSRVRYIDEEEMMACEDGKDEDKKTYGYSFSIEKVSSKNSI